MANNEQAAWTWLEGMVLSLCDEEPSDIAYSADQMVDAFMAGAGTRPTQGHEALVEALFAEIAHGDEDHRAWLKNALLQSPALTNLPTPQAEGELALVGRLERVTAELDRIAQDNERFGQSPALDRDVAERAIHAIYGLYECKAGTTGSGYAWTSLQNILGLYAPRIPVSPQAEASPLDDGLVAELERLMADATEGALETAEVKTSGGFVTCPCCDGEGEVDLDSQYTNFDGLALGVQFFGIGKHFGAHERLWSFFCKNRETILTALRARPSGDGEGE